MKESDFLMGETTPPSWPGKKSQKGLKGEMKEQFGQEKFSRKIFEGNAQTRDFRFFLGTKNLLIKIKRSLYRDFFKDGKEKQAQFFLK